MFKTRPLTLIFTFLLVARCQTMAGAIASDPVTHITIVRDSTAAGYPPERVGQIGWGQALPYFLPHDVTVLNLALNGSSTRSFVDEGKWGTLVDQVGSTRPADYMALSSSP